MQVNYLLSCYFQRYSERYLTRSAGGAKNSRAVAAGKYYSSPPGYDRLYDRFYESAQTATLVSSVDDPLYQRIIKEEVDGSTFVE